MAYRSWRSSLSIFCVEFLLAFVFLFGGLLSSAFGQESDRKTPSPSHGLDAQSNAGTPYPYLHPYLQLYDLQLHARFHWRTLRILKKNLLEKKGMEAPLKRAQRIKGDLA